MECWPVRVCTQVAFKVGTHIDFLGNMMRSTLQLHNFGLLEQAIKEHYIVTFLYDGCRRTVEPFLIGTTTRGNLSLRGFQISGESNSRKVPAWRIFHLEKITDLCLTNEMFDGLRPEFNPNDKHMREVYVYL